MSGINRTTAISFNAGAAKSNQASLTDANTLITADDIVREITGETVSNSGELVTGVFAGAMGIQHGALRAIAAANSNPESPEQKAIQDVEVIAGITQVVGGTEKIISSTVKAAAASVTSTAVKTNLTGISTILGKISSGFSLVFSALTLVKPSMKNSLCK